MYMLGGKTSSYRGRLWNQTTIFKSRHCHQQRHPTSLAPCFLTCKVHPPTPGHRVVAGAIACEAAGPWTALTAFRLWLYICCSRVLVLLALSDRAPASLIPSPQITSSSPEFLSLFSPFCLTGLPLTPHQWFFPGLNSCSFTHNS